MILFVRFITSLFYAGLLLGSLYTNIPFFSVVIFAMTLISLFEIQRITTKKAAVVYAFFPLILLLSFVFEQANLVLIISGIFGVILMVTFLFAKKNIDISKTFVTVLGGFGVSIPLVMLALLSVQNPDFVAFFFGIIWLNDSGAYLVGTTIGKRALAAKISPNKTIEGNIGGIVITTIIMFFVGRYFELFDTKTILALTIITAICGGLGDLVQSKIKRQCGVKDSGKILPGHGGMYDRLDSSLLAIPVYILILFVFGYVS